MTVAEINALLYSSRHPRDQLERALRIPALSPGWRWSFEALARSQDAHPGATGNAGLVPAVAAQTAAPGFRPLRVSRIDHECVDVISLSLQPTDGSRLTTPLAGQFVVLRLRPRPDGPPLFRSYSLSGPLSDEQYRVSVKVEPNGAAGSYLNGSVRAGDVLDVSEPRGSFTLQSGDGPVVLLSAGIGATPVLAMLHALAASASPREIWWLHGARNGKSHSFAAEVRQLLGTLARGRSQIWYSRPDAEDRVGRDYDATGRLAMKDPRAAARPARGRLLPLRAIELPRRAEAGPDRLGRAPGTGSIPRSFRGGPSADARRGRHPGAPTASAGGHPRHRTAGVLRTQRALRSLATVGRPEPSRVGGSV